jgi:hypothetical protein
MANPAACPAAARSRAARDRRRRFRRSFRRRLGRPVIPWASYRFSWEGTATPALPIDAKSAVENGENIVPSRVIVPPGGFPGFAQQTPSNQNAFARAAGRRGGRTTQRRRRSRAASAVPSRRRRRRAARAPRARRSSRGRAQRFVKGSAAAKRYMAKLRRMRRRK